MHTHVGYRPHTGYLHASRFRQHIPKAGKRHALTGGPDAYKALCGEVVMPETHDEFGFRLEIVTNVWAVGTPDSLEPNCEKCLKIANKGL